MDQPSPIQSVEPQLPPRLPFPLAGWGRVVYALFLLTMPAFSFWAVTILEPEYQTGEFRDYLILLLFPEASLFFIFLLAYSVGCYLLLMLVPDRFSRFFAVRLGIYAGVVLALQYSLLVLAYVPYALLIGASLPALSWLFKLAAQKWGQRTMSLIFLGMVLAAYLVLVLIWKEPFAPLFFILVGLSLGSPFWSLLIASRAALWLVRAHETGLTLPRGLGLVAWLGAYAAAWRYDILKMYELYAQLPPNPPPDCYIATAAAQGHPRLVGSRRVVRADGSRMRVNRQLQILKCAELALMGLSPRLHHSLRRAYDALGRPLARRIRNPWLADLAWLSLKPLEALARTGLRVLVPEIEAISARIYV